MPDADPALYHPVSLNREYLAGKLIERIAKEHPRTWDNLSMDQRVRVRIEFLNTIQSLEESLATDSPAFLIDLTCWEQSRFAAGHFPEKFSVTFLTIFKEVLSRELPQDKRKNADTCIRKALTILKSGTCPDDRTPTLSPVARSFLRHLLEGDESRAVAVIDKTITAGMHVREVYTGILQPVLQETGRLWQQDETSIAQEHYISGVIRRIMDQQRNRLAERDRKIKRGKTVVAACAGEELHEIGIRMVADLFEMEGWKVYYTGGNVPAKSILDAVKERKADIVALSITMPSRLTDLRYLIRSLRADADTAQVKVIVGGYPFALIPDLWKRIGADAFAPSAEEAVAAAIRLTA